MRLAVGTITIVVGLLLILGLTMLNSIGMHHPSGLQFFYQQCQWLVIGLVACVTASTIDYRRTRGFAFAFLGFTMVLLVLARVPGISREVNGAWRWLRVGPVTFQPSELAKVALILAIAAYTHVNRRRMDQPLIGLVIPGAMAALVLALVLVGKDLGTTALLALLTASMLYAAGSRLRHLVPVGLAGVLVLATYLATDPVRWRRVEAFLHPEKYAETIALQSTQSKIAIGSGGITGLGLGNGIHKSGFVPEQVTDFIFSVIGEELGLRVTLPLVAAYLAFSLAALRIARKAPDGYGAMIALGIGLLVGYQAVINIAVSTDSVPNKGLALPFVSYGGSCLVVMLTLVGLLISVACRSAREESEENLPEGTDREASALQNA
ncbi:MAG: FtsW/RodA/SpoVE family cell cycle protein [Limisphaerales bacterium]